MEEMAKSFWSNRLYRNTDSSRERKLFLESSILCCANRIKELYLRFDIMLNISKERQSILMVCFGVMMAMIVIFIT